MKSNFILLTALLLLSAIALCGPDEISAGTALQGCTGCHTAIEPGSNHNFRCTECHQGRGDTTDKALAHKELITAPSAPDNMEKFCGKCHARQITGCAASLHFTLKNAVNAVRNHFSISPELSDLRQIPESGIPQTPQELVDDMLRRRCLRCHVYTSGDSYPYVQRGTGCAACHMDYIDGKLQSHTFTPPTERRCLSCHYGNHVGSDYVGTYEHDFNWEYRTPYTTKAPFLRPYGVELHQLAPDIHSQRGLTCMDCHTGATLSGKQQPVTCESCHSAEIGDSVPLPNIRIEKNQRILKTAADGKDHLIPKLIHPAHAKYRGRVACQVCHAQWGFNDSTTSLLLSYSDDVDAWDRLTVQSSSTVETFLEHNLYSDEDELEATMIDSITGRNKSGIWYLGFTQRRWEDIILQKDRDGIIKVFRPILDLRLSAVDENDEVLFDNLQGKGTGLLPYTPHTTGSAGLFYEQRFINLMKPVQTDGTVKQ